MADRVGERVYDGVDKMTAEDLLTHLQAEPELFPELQGLACWADLPIDKISDELLDKITQKGITGDFKGQCPRCPH